MQQIHNQEVRTASARVAVAAKFGRREDEQTARQDLATAAIDAFIQRKLAEAPPLRPDQLARLRRLLASPRAGKK